MTRLKERFVDFLVVGSLRPSLIQRAWDQSGAVASIWATVILLAVVQIQSIKQTNLIEGDLS